MATIEFYIPNPLRTKTIKSIKEYVTDKQSITDIEEGIYDYTQQYCTRNSDPTVYHAVYKDVIRNLIYDCSQNKQTINKIITDVSNKKINGYNLAFLSPEERDTDNWEKIIQRKNNTEEKLNNLPTVPWKPCKHCKCTQYSFYQLQTRSADEPMTKFYICKECKTTYKVNQ